MMVLSRNLFNRLFKEDIYGFVEKRIFPLIADYLSSDTQRILDAACGYGNPYLASLKLENSVGIDLNPDVKSKNPIHKKFVIQDLHELHLEEKFDLIFSLYTWEHLNDPSLVLKNFYRCLKTKGMVIIIASQRWHYISMAAKLLPAALKAFSWRLLKNRKRMPFPVYYRVCSERSLRRAAQNLRYRLVRYEAIEGPPLWFSKITPLFLLGCWAMVIMNKWSFLKRFRGTFVAVLEKNETTSATT